MSHGIIMRKNNLSMVSAIALCVALAGGTASAAVGPRAESPVIQRVGTDLVVTDFGAKGDGVTDDTEALQKAADAYLSRGILQNHHWRRNSYKDDDPGNDSHQGRLIFPRGKYRISKPILFRKRVYLVGDGAEIIQSNPGEDVFYVVETYVCRCFGLSFTGGKVQLRLPTHNTECANLRIRDCRFVGAGNSGVECRAVKAVKRKHAVHWSTRDNLCEWYYDNQAKKYAKDPRWLEPVKGCANSTLAVIENCEFDDCARAIDMATDGVVFRNSRVLSRRNATGPAIACTTALHAYNLDVTVRRNPALEQSVFEGSGWHFWFEDSVVRSDDGSGVPIAIVRGKRNGGYIPNSIVIENVETETPKDSGVIVVDQGNLPPVVALVRVRERAGRAKATAFHFRPEPTDEMLHRQRMNLDYDMSLKQSYALVVKDCEGLLPPTGPMAAYLQEPGPNAAQDLVKVAPLAARKGPVLVAADDGVDADPATDDTAAMKKFLMRLAATPGATGLLPGTRLTVRETLPLAGDFALVGAGVTVFAGMDEATTLFRAESGARVTLSSLNVRGGGTAVDVAAGADVRIDGSWFWDQAQPTFRTAKGGTIVDDAGVVYARRWYEGEGAARFTAVWFRFLDPIRHAVKGEKERPLSALVNRGQLEVWDILGVPCVFEYHYPQYESHYRPWLPTSEYRWVDNYGEYSSRSFRYGGEWGGVTPVFQFGAAKTRMEGYLSWYYTSYVHRTPVLSDTPEPDVELNFLISGDMGPVVPNHEVLWRPKPQAFARRAKGDFFHACYPTPFAEPEVPLYRVEVSVSVGTDPVKWKRLKAQIEANPGCCDELQLTGAIDPAALTRLRQECRPLGISVTSGDPTSGTAACACADLEDVMERLAAVPAGEGVAIANTDLLPLLAEKRRILAPYAERNQRTKVMPEDWCVFTNDVSALSVKATARAVVGGRPTTKGRVRSVALVNRGTAATGPLGLRIRGLEMAGATCYVRKATWFPLEGDVKEIPVTSWKGIVYLTVPDLAAESAGWIEFY